MRRALLCGIAVVFLASSAIAVTLAPLPAYTGQTATEGRSLTQDGSALVGTSGTAGGMFWSMTRSGTSVTVAAAPTPLNVTTWGTLTTASGLATRTVGGQQQLVAQGMSAGWSATVTSMDGGATWSQGFRSSGIGSAPGVGVSNTLGANGIDDSFFDCFSSDGSGTNLYVEKFTGNPPALVSRDAKGTTQKSSIQGVSAAGKAVGRRKGDGTNYYNYKLVYGGAGGLAASYFNGLDGTSKGEAWAVSADGNKIFGYSPATGKTGSWPYMRDDVANTIVALPTLNPASAAVTNGAVYGTSADGHYAVGMDFTLGVERAVLWNTVDNTELDLTTWATNHGILGAFTGNLRRAYSVGVGADGTVILTGYGYAPTLSTGWTGFILAVPEPTSVLFLAIGGLALLRRR